MHKREISSLLFLITWIVSIHGANSNIALLTTIDGKTAEPSSKSLSLNDSVCNLHLCQSPKGDAFLTSCSCRKDCFKNGRCCLGLFTEEEEENLIQEDFYEVYHHEDFYDGNFIKVVGRCPWNAINETEIQQCHNSVANTRDPKMMFPMISVKTNIVYKNWACGKCNEGSDTQFQLELICPEEHKLPVTIEEGIHLYLTNRSCLPTIPSEAIPYYNNYDFLVSNETVIHCPSSFSNDYFTKWRCSTYLAPFTFDGRRYKNIFCAKCNGVTVKQEDMVCRETLYSRNDTYTFQIDANFSVGGEFSFSDIQSRCPPESVYDPYQNQCRFIYSDNSTSHEEESTLNINEESGVISNTLKRVSIPKCDYQIYNVTEYEINSSTFFSHTGVVIKATNATFKTGEYEYMLDGKIEVCIKQKNDSVPLCVDHYCPRKNSNAFRQCSCNSNCFQKGDCCIDALTHKEFSSLRESDFLTCIRLSSDEKVFAINQCPKHYPNIIVRSNCESLPVNDSFLETPVYSSLTNVTYKNIYCGICHDARDLLFFPSEISCIDLWNSRTPATALRWTKGDNSKCTLNYKTMLSPVSNCDDEIEYKCPKDWELSMDALKKEINSMCRTIEAPIRIFESETVKDYRNIYCAQCNGFDPHSESIHQCNPNIGGGGVRISGPGYAPPKVPRPRHLGVLFTIG